MAPQTRASLAPWLALAALVVLADQFTKTLITGWFQLGDSRPVIEGFFNLVRAHNRGAAFSFLSEASGWLVRFVHPGFAVLKPVAFLASQAFLGLMLALLAAFLLRAGRRSALEAVGEAPPDEAPRRAAAP